MVTGEVAKRLRPANELNLTKRTYALVRFAARRGSKSESFIDFVDTNRLKW